MKQLQIDYLNFYYLLKGNYRKGVHALKSILLDGDQSKMFAENFSAVSLILSYDKENPDKNAVELYDLLTHSNVIDTATNTYICNLYDVASLEELVSNKDIMTEVAANELSMSALVFSKDAMSIVAGSETAMTEIAANDMAMTTVTNNDIAVTAVTTSETAMNVICSNQNAFNIITTSSDAMSILNTSPMAQAKNWWF